MPTLNAFLNAQSLTLWSAGTPDGAKKGWDTRGRGRKQEQPAPKQQPEPAYGKDPRYYRPAKWSSQSGMVDIQPLANKYKAMGQKIQDWHKKLEYNPNEVHTTAQEFLHFLKDVGDWVESYSGLRDLVIGASLAVLGAMHYSTRVSVGVHNLANVLTHSFMSIAPAVSHAMSMMGLLH